MKGTGSAQKALQGSETETRELLGGTTENSVSPMRGHYFALQANKLFFSKGKQKKFRRWPDLVGFLHQFNDSHRFVDILAGAGDEGERLAPHPGSTGSSDPVHIVLRVVSQVIVDYRADTSDVQPP